MSESILSGCLWLPVRCILVQNSSHEVLSNSKVPNMFFQQFAKVGYVLHIKEFNTTVFFFIALTYTNILYQHTNEKPLQTYYNCHGIYHFELAVYTKVKWYGLIFVLFAIKDGFIHLERPFDGMSYATYTWNRKTLHNITTKHIFFW